jgi:hypothetical protein
MDNDFKLNFLEPDSSIAGFVESIGMFYNQSANDKEVVVLYRPIFLETGIAAFAGITDRARNFSGAKDCSAS